MKLEFDLQADAGYLELTEAQRQPIQNAGVDVQRLVPAWESLQSVVQIRHIDSEAEYEQTIALLNSLLDVVRDNASHPLYSLVSVLCLRGLVERIGADHRIVRAAGRAPGMRWVLRLKAKG